MAHYQVRLRHTFQTKSTPGFLISYFIDHYMLIWHFLSRLTWHIVTSVALLSCGESTALSKSRPMQKLRVYYIHVSR